MPGLDISRGDVAHAKKRSEARSVNNVNFVHGNMDKRTFASESTEQFRISRRRSLTTSYLI